MSTILTISARNVLYLRIHNKLPVRERLVRIGVAINSYCDVCPGAEICDISHYFCSCVRMAAVWQEVRAFLVGMVGGRSQLCSDLELLMLQFPKSRGGEFCCMVGLQALSLQQNGL